jgi:uncharacterized protein YegP (UPF0339 family)
MIPIVLNEIALLKKCINKQLVIKKRKDSEGYYFFTIHLPNEKQTIIAQSPKYNTLSAHDNGISSVIKHSSSIFAVDHYENEYKKVYKDSEQIAYIKKDEDSDQYYFTFNKTSDNLKKVYMVPSIGEALKQITGLTEINYSSEKTIMEDSYSELESIIKKIEESQEELWEGDLSKAHPVVKLSDPWFKELKSFLKKLEKK